jgi:hypothetical protein
VQTYLTLKNTKEHDRYVIYTIDTSFTLKIQVNDVSLVFFTYNDVSIVFFTYNDVSLMLFSVRMAVPKK